MKHRMEWNTRMDKMECRWMGLYGALDYQYMKEANPKHYVHIMYVRYPDVTHLKWDGMENMV